MLSNSPTERRGFTLIELAIVLVIIGLIVGGVLVGQDMIKGATVRATAGQFEKYNAAINTFRDKYRQLAGDATLTVAAQFGLPVRPAGSGGRGQHDGNGVIEACAASAVDVGCESVTIWEDLNAAGLLDSTYTQPVSNSLPTWSTNNISTYLPASRLNQNTYITAFASLGKHYYQMTGLTVSAGALAITKSISPIQAFNIDQKLDDGRPTTGNTMAAVASGATFNNTTATTLISDQCIDAAGLLYFTSSTSAADTPACGLRLRFN